MKQVTEALMGELKAGLKRFIAVEPVDGEEMRAWVNRNGDVNLTKVDKSVTINLQVATVEGASPENAL